MVFFGNKKNKEEKKQQTEKKSVKISDEKNKDTKKSSMKDLYGTQNVGQKSENKSQKLDKKSKNYGNAYKVLIKPLITEKAASFGVNNKYIFEVSKDANKIEIVKAINEVYGVSPIKVNIVNKLGKKVRSGRIMGQRKNWKKAVITLPKGKTINIYEGV